MVLRSVAVAAAMVLIGGTSWAQEGDPAAGEVDFAQCAVCHQIGPTAQNMVGPVLNGIIGRQIGTYPGFDYGPATKAKGEDGTVWSHDLLMEYLINPTAFIGGPSKMPMMYPDEQFRRDVIAYISQFDANGERTQ